MKYAVLAVIAAMMFVLADAQPHGDGLIGLTRAVASAERHLSARAIQAKLETRDDRIIYEVDLVRGVVLPRATVDARSGRLLSSERLRIENWARAWIDGDRLRIDGKTSPVAARLDALERQSGGQIQAVELGMHKGRAVFRIELATAAGVGEVRIDALTGQRLELAYDD